VVAAPPSDGPQRSKGQQRSNGQQRTEGQQRSNGQQRTEGQQRSAGRQLPRAPKLTGTAPAHVEIERWLVAAIGRRELSAGDKLPPEAELAARIGVSRMTLRQALGRLEARGVITRRPGRRGGTFVAEPRIDVDLTGWAGFTAQLRRAHVRAGAQVVLARTLPATPDVATALALARGEPVHEVARVRSAQRLPVALERSWFPAAAFPGLLDHRLTGSLYTLLHKEFGHQPRTAEEFVDPVVADPDSARLLGVEHGRPLLRVERTAYTAAGLAVEFARDLFRTDRVRLHVRSDLGPG
jgi:GntR family transcriptional regulator